MTNTAAIAATINAEWVAAHESQFSPDLAGDRIDLDEVVVFISADRTEAFVWAGNEADPDFERQVRVAL